MEIAQTKKPARRLVGRGEYAWLYCKTLAAMLFGIALLPLYTLLCVITLGLIVAFVSAFVVELSNVVTAILHHSKNSQGNHAGIVGCWFLASVVCGAAAHALGKWADALQEYNGVEDAVCCSRDELARFADTDSLVRASEEPAQTQEAILLRAVTGDSQDKYTELLVRAANKQDSC